MTNPFPEDISNKIQELRSKLRRHDHQYYVDARPQITDSEYDTLRAQLLALEVAYPEFRSRDSPSHRLGREPIDGFREMIHRVPMLPIENIFAEDEPLYDWDAAITKSLERDAAHYLIEYKIDGVAIDLTWEHGNLVRGVARDIGIVGDDLTPNAKVIGGIRSRLMVNNIPASLEVHGTVTIMEDQLFALQQQQIRAGELPYKNSHDAVADKLKQLDPRQTQNCGLTFFAHSFGHADGITWNSYNEFLHYIQKRGIPTTPNVSHAKGFVELLPAMTEMISRVPELPFVVDGLLIKLDNLADRQQLGATSRYLRWARSYKWETQDLGDCFSNLRDCSAGTETSPMKLAGKTFVVTGSTVRLTRDEIEQLIRDHGGKTNSSLSLETEFVVAGEDSGSKLASARQLGVRVLTEDEFLAMLATDEFPTSHIADSPWVNKESHPSEKLDTGLARSGQEETDSKAALHESISQLNSMIGLSGVKAEVNRLVSFLRIQRERRKHGLRESGQTLHFVFTGNPGTGKTTVARIISKILYGFGLLKTSKVVECDRSDLIGGFVGQTAIKTNEKIESALDGVLFIDEAYTLAGDALNYGHGDMYGDEAINTLLKRMEDCRDRLVVIVAGYPALMRKFICANPGLESRFTRYICFEDYNVSDLCQIFEKFCRDAEYSLSASGRVWASILFTIAYDQRDERFGNARFIRNVFERATSLHSERLADVPEEQITKEMLGTLDGNDLSFEFVKNIDRNLIDVSNARWLGDCPSCGALVRGNAKVIGRHASCKKCNEIFSFPWWTLERDTVPGVPPALG